jgi:hypothetical protein
MQTMQTAVDFLEALRPLIEKAVMRHSDGRPFGADTIIRTHHVRWSSSTDPSGNHLRSEAASRFLQELGWSSHGFPHEEHIRALLVARYGLEYAMLASGTSSWASDDVAALLEQFRQS